MGGTDIRTAKPAGADEELAGLEAGLDSLDSVPVSRTPVRQVLRQKVAPPLLAAAFVLVAWQLVHAGGWCPRSGCRGRGPSGTVF
ncbi:hypothetical protein SHKM778_25560 [Streptomyces sp. KM77-8]|uniref:ABC transporter permease n=1 Tax=Streptomyces haneummycinicus TaxID=3074435 RepID=A0AAT9HFR1_9ACTN